MKINEIVVFYMDKDEKEADFPKIDWPIVDPKYSTLKNISKRYSFMMRGRGRANNMYCCGWPL